MANDLVRVHVNGQSINISATVAEREGLDVVDESTHNRDGSVRRASRANGRPAKKKTTVATQAAEKAAVTKSAPDEKGSDQ